MESIGKAKSGILFAISNFDIRNITFTFAAEKNARPSGPNPLILSIDLEEGGIHPTTTSNAQRTRKFGIFHYLRNLRNNIGQVFSGFLTSISEKRTT